MTDHEEAVPSASHRSYGLLSWHREAGRARTSWRKLLHGALRIVPSVIGCRGMVLICALFAGNLSAGAQHHGASHEKRDAGLSPEAALFVEQARVATASFERLESAIAAGYRAIGPDMPGMGEHWINPRLAMWGQIDPARPAVLTYLRIDGLPRLTGVAYATPVAPGESPPRIPFDDATWHAHAGSIEEELVGGSHHEPDTGATYLAMFHAWIWTENPAGVFAADNWALSYLRQGLTPPPDASPAAAQALFLGTDAGQIYYLDRLQLVLRTADSGESGGGSAMDPLHADAPRSGARVPALDREDAVLRVLDGARNRISTLVASMETGEPPPTADLESVWRAMWTDLRQVLGETVWQSVAHVAGADPD